MLKSRGRTDEVPVMGMEEWPQVVVNNIKINQSYKEFEHDEKGLLQERPANKSQALKRVL